MCGRFVLFSDLQHIQLAFDLADSPVSLTPSYNIAPTHQVWTVVRRAGSNTLETMRWGLIPSWAKDPKIGARMINARAETLAEKPSFKRALAQQRCLIIADGFYEWRTDGKTKTPMFIHCAEHPIGLAGLYDTWKSPEGETITTCTIVTTNANETLQAIHDRMPVILAPAAQRIWLDPHNHDAPTLLALLKPYPASDMQAHAVSPLVNSPKHNAPDCIQPVKSSSSVE